VITRLENGSLELCFPLGDYTLLESDTVDGTYTPVANQTNPYIVMPGASGSKFYQIR
jgi:hypothetical protein